MHLNVIGMGGSRGSRVVEEVRKKFKKIEEERMGKLGMHDRTTRGF